MAIKVLIVDDSSFFRKRLKEIVSGDPELEVVGEAKDGKEGVDMAARLRPDVITMDVEMPVMDGISAVREIMSHNPLPILMFSSLTVEGADATFRALEAGAVDFMTKNFEDIAHKKEDAFNQLRSNIRAVSRSRVSRLGTAGVGARSASVPRTASAPAPRPAAAPSAPPRIIGSTIAPNAQPATGTVKASVEKIYEMLGSNNPSKPAAAKAFTFGDHKDQTTRFRKSGKKHDIVLIGSSTGGPVALQNIIPKLPQLRVPLVVVQHMPGSFTTTFAQRLDAISKNHVCELKDGDVLEPGNCYITPGGQQMIFEKGIGKVRVRIFSGDGRVTYNPCVDVTFASAVQSFGGRVLAMILTGMGSDGCEGCRLLKKQGAVIWAQNEDTCVVYGMPQAVVNENLAEQILPLDQFASSIAEELS